MPEYKCGCINEPHDPSGILHCVRKCRHHAARYRDPATLDERYFRELGVLDGDTPHVAQLVDALGLIPLAREDDIALEIGCGASPYAGAILERDWCYAGLDCSRWAAAWTAERWDVETIVRSWEDWEPPCKFGLILAAHCIEHMHDAPWAVAKMGRHLTPGGELWVVVPDDTDPTNPDHWWMFSPDTLRATLESAGLQVERIEVRKYVEHENFLYARARRPS